MRTLFLICWFSAMSVGLAAAQVSVGFDDPKDIENLLDYRLPDWGYKTWDAMFSLGGSGYEARLAGNKSISNRFNTSLDSQFKWYRESEVCERTLSAALRGNYNRNHSGDEGSERSGHSLGGGYDFSLRAKRFLGDTPFAIIGSASDSRDYRETSSNFRYDDVWDRTDTYSRSNYHRFSIGLGVGRLRDVVPLIRAERLSERLDALGLRRLTDAEVQHVAEVIATEYGYARVYQREDRHFWGDVLEPILDVQLTPYQVYYLSEILNEDVGQRRQGFSVEAEWDYRGYIASVSSQEEDNTSRDRNASLIASWSHNLSLDRQLMAHLGWHYSFRNSGRYDDEYASLVAALEHLWNVADRHTWTSRLNYDGDSNISGDSRERSVNLDSTWNMRIEDQLSLRVNAGLRYYWRKWHSTSPSDHDITHGWNWGYGVSFVYHLDRVLL
jgi:hypothetical protein